jgi:polyferredoxin
MTTHTRYHFIGIAVVLAYLLIALFAILLAAPLLFLLTHIMGAACCSITGTF